MPIGNIWSGISFRYDDSIFVALAEPCKRRFAITRSVYPQVTGVELTGAGLVISCSQDATLRIWSLDTGAVIRVVHNKLHITVTRDIIILV